MQTPYAGEAGILLHIFGKFIIKPIGQNRIAKIGYGHLYLREENLSFDNHCIILELYFSIINISNKLFYNIWF
jgi:hypothetical protein